IVVDISAVAAVSSFFIALATAYVYTLSLHDALPISAQLSHHVWRLCQEPAGRRVPARLPAGPRAPLPGCGRRCPGRLPHAVGARSEEHTSELQSRENLVCRLLLEKKNVKSHYLQY